MSGDSVMSRKKNIICCIVAVLIACFLLFPLYWALNTSLKTEQEIFRNPPTFLDGCNRFTAFLRILIPIAKPGVMVCAIFSFLYAWGDLAYGMTFILDQEMRPITAGIFNFMWQYGTKWSYLTAFAVVTIIPLALIFIFMQKYIVSGMTSGAVKG